MKFWNLWTNVVWRFFPDIVRKFFPNIVQKLHQKWQSKWGNFLRASSESVNIFRISVVVSNLNSGYLDNSKFFFEVNSKYSDNSKFFSGVIRRISDNCEFFFHGQFEQFQFFSRGQFGNSNWFTNYMRKKYGNSSKSVFFMKIFFF
jgi:hypothetical protein